MTKNYKITNLQFCALTFSLRTTFPKIQLLPDLINWPIQCAFVNLFFSPRFNQTHTHKKAIIK